MPDELDELEHDSIEDGDFKAVPISKAEVETSSKDLQRQQRREALGVKEEEPWCNANNPAIWTGVSDED